MIKSDFKLEVIYNVDNELTRESPDGHDGHFEDDERTRRKQQQQDDTFTLRLRLISGPVPISRVLYCM